MEQLNTQKQGRRTKLVSIILFVIIFGIFAVWVEIQANDWWKVRKEYVRMGFASDKFPFRMYTEKELVEKGLWSGESPALNAVPTRTTPEETYATFRQALIDGDLDKAAECFIPAKQEAWRISLNDITNKGFLSEMISDLPEELIDIEVGHRSTLNTSSTAYHYIFKNDPKKSLQTMTFLKNWDGDWKIEDL